MREITPEECKKILLNILINVAQFCDEHNIKYSLAYGTLIGAIRHKGFIPWDDDVDIMMARDEYERFVNLYKDNYYVLIPGEKLANHYHVVVSDMATTLKFKPHTENDHFYKGGIWVDIFPIDNVPDTIGIYRKMMRKLHLMASLEITSQFVKNKKRFLLHILLKPFAKLLRKKISETIEYSKRLNTNTVGNLSLWYLKYPSFSASIMSDFINVEFEGHLFKAVKDYDEYLKGIYGDYMKLPPLNERNHRHSYTAYWRK